MAVMKVGAAGIETISGALKRPKKQNGHSHGNYLVATHRVAATTNPDCQRVYSFEADRYERSTQPTSKELAVRARFTAVAAAIKTRKADLMRVAEDEAAFMAQKNLPGGKKTLKAWYWMVEGQAYDQEHGN